MIASIKERVLKEGEFYLKGKTIRQIVKNNKPNEKTKSPFHT